MTGGGEVKHFEIKCNHLQQDYENNLIYDNVNFNIFFLLKNCKLTDQNKGELIFHLRYIVHFIYNTFFTTLSWSHINYLLRKRKKKNKDTTECS